MGNSKKLKAYWYRSKVRNFGDEITPYLIENLFERQPCYSEGKIPFFDRILFGAGSIIAHAKKPYTARLWGSGIISRTDKFVRPLSVLAVRGPETRLHLLKHGVSCPESYGDPGVLLPLVYRPSVSRGSAVIGVVPHYVDYERAQRVLGDALGYRLIDVRKGVEDVVDAIAGCDCVISSSLHGLIVASAYGVPSCWVKFSPDLFGDDVKFHDFYGACNTKRDPLWIHDLNDLAEAARRAGNYVPDVSWCQKSLMDNLPVTHGVQDVCLTEPHR